MSKLSNEEKQLIVTETIDRLSSPMVLDGDIRKEFEILLEQSDKLSVANLVSLYMVIRSLTWEHGYTVFFPIKDKLAEEHNLKTPLIKICKNSCKNLTIDEGEMIGYADVSISGRPTLFPLDAEAMSMSYIFSNEIPIPVVNIASRAVNKLTDSEWLNKQSTKMDHVVKPKKVGNVLTVDFGSRTRH